MALQGKRQMQARLKALSVAFKGYGRDWADDYVKLAKPQIPEDTGKTRRSVRRASATQKRAVVRASHVAYFIDKGPKAHVITAKKHNALVFQAQGRTVFARQVHHRGYRGRPFRHRTAILALKRNPMAKRTIAAYNGAA